MLCSIDLCEEKVYGRDWCKNHYQRWYRNGDPNTKLCAANGEGGLSTQGYRCITVNGERVLEHRYVAELALGRPLPRTVEVHHVNGNKQDNLPSNLVICPGAKYHQLLHIRAEAIEATGNPNFRKCIFCREFDSPENLKGKREGEFHHLKCRREYRRKK